MISFFPDLNVWLALSVRGHGHSGDAWSWLRAAPDEARLVFSRYTQVGLLRLLTNRAVMGAETLTLRRAWGVYDRWQEDPRVEFYLERRDIEAIFRDLTLRYARLPATKLVGDCYVLALAVHSGATLVTFDGGLLELARKEGHRAVMPG